MSSHLTQAAQEQAFPTEWTSTHKNYETSKGAYMVFAENLTPPPPGLGQRVTGNIRNEEGRKIECSVGHNRYVKYIKPCGTVGAIPVKTCRALERDGRPVDNGSYSVQVTEELERTGHVNYATGKGAPREYLETWTIPTSRKLKDEHGKEIEVTKIGREWLIFDWQQTQAKEMKQIEDKHKAEFKAKELEMQKTIAGAFAAMEENLKVQIEKTKAAKRERADG